MLFSSWAAMGRVLLVGALGYLALVLLLRISGKRTLSKFNAFDLVITVAIGSSFATVLLSKSVALAEGVTAFAVLVLLQYVVTWLSVRIKAVDRLVKSEPTLIFYRGEFLHETMKRERITEGDVLAAIRASCIPSLADVEAVVMETAGEISIVRRSPDGASNLLGHVHKPEASYGSHPLGL